MSELRYASSFDQFLAATDEKDVMELAILDAVVLDGSQRMLDIGAGDGNLVKRLTPHVASYVAVEMNPDFMEGLAAAGASVIPGEYPVTDAQVQGQFDVVLSSYSSPMELKALRTFIDAAWKRVLPGGTLVLISFGFNDEWGRIMTELEAVVPLARLRGYSTDEAATQRRHQELLQMCKQLGATEATTIISTVQTKTPQELFEVVGFLASAGVDDAIEAYYAAQEKIEPLLMAGRSKPAIPHSHAFIVVRKAMVV